MGEWRVIIIINFTKCNAIISILFDFDVFCLNVDKDDNKKHIINLLKMIIA